jgi:hypothetical protein
MRTGRCGRDSVPYEPTAFCNSREQILHVPLHPLSLPGQEINAAALAFDVLLRRTSFSVMELARGSPCGGLSWTGNETRSEISIRSCWKLRRRSTSMLSEAVIAVRPMGSPDVHTGLRPTANRAVGIRAGVSSGRQYGRIVPNELGRDSHLQHYCPPAPESVHISNLWSCDIASNYHHYRLTHLSS